MASQKKVINATISQAHESNELDRCAVRCQLIILCFFLRENLVQVIDTACIQGDLAQVSNLVLIEKLHDHILFKHVLWLLKLFKTSLLDQFANLKEQDIFVLNHLAQCTLPRNPLWPHIDVRVLNHLLANVHRDAPHLRLRWFLCIKASHSDSYLCLHEALKLH